MKDKSRVTEMIDIAADGYRLPVAIIGKPKKSVCFKMLVRDEEIPFPYKNQNNAWSDKDITRWWINNVFWTHHFR